MLLLLVLLLVLLAASALFSGSETALFGLSRHQLSQLRRDPQPTHRLAARLMEHPRKLLLTLMIGNVALNMFVFATSLAFFDRLVGRHSVLAAILGLVSPVLLTLCTDILPKGLAVLMGPKMAVRVAPIVEFAQIALAPVRVLLNAIVEPLTRLLTGGQPPGDYVTVDELRELIVMSERHRIINPDENAMLGEVIELGELRVRDIMVHRMDMVAFEIDDDPDELRRLLREHHFSKLPIYEGSIDRIVGMVYARDVFLDPERPVRQLVRPVGFVPEMIRLTQLLAHFRRTRSQLAVAVDEYGGVVGLVTVEDVAEEIVGDLVPSARAEEPDWQQLEDGRYRVAGSLSVRDWAEQFNVERVDERVTTLSGLILTRLGRPAAVGDTVRVGNLQLTVAQMDGRRIDWVLLELQPRRRGSKRTGTREGLPS